jgi:hypothetical protein
MQKQRRDEFRFGVCFQDTRRLELGITTQLEEGCRHHSVLDLQRPAVHHVAEGTPVMLLGSPAVGSQVTLLHFGETTATHQTQSCLNLRR